MFDGWVPREVHETYAVDPADPDAEPVRTGYVVVTRESEWDDNTRARALGWVQYEESICNCGCGLPRAVAHSKQQAALGFRVHEFTCYAQKSIERHRRSQRVAHKDAPDGWDDALHYYATAEKPPDEPEARR